MNPMWRRSQGLWLKDFTFLIILLWVLTWESLDQLKLLGLGQITLDAVVLWNHLGKKGEIAKSEEQKSKNWEGKDFSQHTHVPNKAGAWHFNSVRRLRDACSPRSAAAHWGSHMAAGATSIPPGKQASVSLLCSTSSSCFPRFRLLLSLQLMVSVPPSEPQHTAPGFPQAHRPQLAPLSPLASLPLEGCSSCGFSLPLVGFLPPTKYRSGDIKTSELEISI